MVTFHPRPCSPWELLVLQHSTAIILKHKNLNLDSQDLLWPDVSVPLHLYFPLQTL